jgi:hypothetical protein
MEWMDVIDSMDGADGRGMRNESDETGASRFQH